MRPRAARLHGWAARHREDWRRLSQELDQAAAVARGERWPADPVPAPMPAAPVVKARDLGELQHPDDSASLAEWGHAG